MKSKATRKRVPAKKAAAPKKKVQPIPAGYGAITPYLSLRGAAQAIEFYKKAFGAKEIMRMPGPDGKLGHTEIRIGDSRVMLSDEYEAMAFLSPQARGGCQTGAPGPGPVLRRPHWFDRRPVRSPVAHRDAQGRPLDGRAETARREGSEEGSG